jgi:hypothetical protein
MSEIIFEDEEDVEQFKTLVDQAVMGVWNNHMKKDLAEFLAVHGADAKKNAQQIEQINNWLGMVYLKKYAFSFAGLLTISILLMLIFTSFFI